MARSAYIPGNAISVTYAFCEYQDEFDFDCITEEIASRLKKYYRRVSETNKWYGREGFIFAENDNYMFGVSEYCGIFALWAIRQNGRNPTKPNLDRFAKYLGEPLESRGYASNGEQFFMPKANMRSVITSKEGRL